MAGCRKRASTIEARLGKKLVWIVDPIDGTRAYLAGRDDWCVSVALVRGRFARARGGVCAGKRRILLRRARAGRRPQRQSAACPPRATICDFSRMAGPKPLVQRLSDFAGRNRRCIRASVRLRCGYAGWRRAVSMPLLRAARAATGTLRRPNLIVQEADGRMTALSGDAIRIIAGTWCTGCWWQRDAIVMRA